MALTTNINLEVPARGSYVGTWDVPNNGDFTIIDACFGAVTAVALSSVSPVALSSSQAQANVLRFTGTLSSNVVVTIPSIIKGWIVDNQCTVGAYAVFLQNASGGEQIGLPPGESIDVYSDGTNVKYRNLGRVGSYLDSGATGVPAWISGSTVPPYLLCDGSTFSAVTYPQLAVVLGGTTLPDARGRSRANLNGGTSRITSAGSGIDGNTRFAGGGFENITLQQAQMPTHTHAISVTDPGHSHTYITFGASGSGINASAPSASGTAAQTNASLTGISVSIGNAGSSAAHNNMGPTYIGGVSMIRAA